VDETRVALNRIIDEIEKSLREQAEDAKSLRILKVEATEHGELKAKFAFLVKRAEFEEFRAAAERMAQEYVSAGVRLELTGPWPAYNFSSETEL
jgi:arginyl-tRNA synthetase